VALSWSAPSSNGGSAVTGYRIYRSSGNGALTLVATVSNVNGWTDTSVNSNTVYYYGVSAVNAVGEGTLSNLLSARHKH
jgi:fibronectin type 3 domain-containing protein